MRGRVLMLVHSYFPRDVRVRRMARAAVAAGYEVGVVALRGEGQARMERWQGIDILRLPMRRHRGAPLPFYLAEYGAFASLAGVRLLGALGKAHWDLVHVHTPPDFLGLAALPLKLRGIPLVLDIHDLSPELYGNRFAGRGGRLAQGLVGAAEQGICRMADRVLTVTDLFAERLTARGVPAEKLRVVHNCPDEEIFNAAEGQRSVWGPGAGPFRVMHHGTLVHRYGLDVLLDAVGLLLADGRDVTLDIYGEGDAMPKLAARAAEAPWAGRVKLHGDVSQEETARALSQAHLCVVPNRNDPFTGLLLPTKLLEALRMGCPALASDTTAIRRYLGDGALLVPPEDPEALASAMGGLMDAPARLAELSQKGRASAEKFRWAEERGKLLEIYDELLGTGP